MQALCCVQDYQMDTPSKIALVCFLTLWNEVETDNTHAFDSETLTGSQQF